MAVRSEGAPSAGAPGSTPHPWRALWALVLGFFMIIIDSTIVSVATPVLIKSLHTDVNNVVWVTSAYLLAYAVPLLITGRLGDRIGPKQLYLTGLTVFTGASLWCGLTGTVDMLIVARAVQGLGAAMMTPQTMAVITRIFPPEQRGRAMSLWGAVAGLGILVGPIAGGVLVDAAGWQWIFFVNVPVGVIGLVLAWRLVPALPTHRHRFDLIGVALSAVGMFCLVFGIQEGRTYNWGTITGSLTVWRLIVAGIVAMVVFVGWQAVNPGEPLVPLPLFRDRNFSLANLAMSTIGFGVTSFAFPLMLYAQDVRGLSPTRAALLFVPMAVISGVLAPPVGRLTERVHPRYLAGIGLVCFPAALFWLSLVMRPSVAVWELMLPLALMGVANGFMWGPIGTTATANLPRHQAGAGSGIYNTTRQVGGVLGSAAIAALMQSRLAAELPGPAGVGSPEASAGVLPPVLHDGFSTAMAQSELLPAVVLVIGLVAALWFARPAYVRGGAKAGAPATTGLDVPASRSADLTG